MSKFELANELYPITYSSMVSLSKAKDFNNYKPIEIYLLFRDASHIGSGIVLGYHIFIFFSKCLGGFKLFICTILTYLIKIRALMS